ncbi:MAG: D-cysteine desulfhydrase [Myxococcales bacterium]|nr:D-cysteine desulfhydrase [Myxococcales bacterium]
MHLARFARRRYTPFATPIERMDHLTEHLGGANLWIKRDDLLGLAAGGNKTRKLEFLVADALEKGADTLITCGAVQSNHCRLTLGAAVKEGLKCRLVLEERVPGSYAADASGNNFLYKLLGVHGVTVVEGGTPLVDAMETVAAEVRAEGGTPYIIPGGGSNAIGSLGYVSCAMEILQQSFELGVEIHHVVCASGSGGTHSGLLTGLHASNSGIPVTGVSVRHPEAHQVAHIHKLAGAVADKLGVATPPAEAVTVLDAYVGEGYSLPTESMREAVQLFARHEGLLLDPVYTGKAAAGLVDQVRKGAFGKDDNVLFLHTGGAPTLFHYRGDVL